MQPVTSEIRNDNLNAGHDLVLSYPVAAEARQRAYDQLSFVDRIRCPLESVEWPSSGGIGRFRFYLYGAAFLLAFLPFWPEHVPSYEYDFYDPLGSLLRFFYFMYFFVVPIVALPFTIRESKMPTNVVVFEHGIAFKWCYKKSITTPVIPWSCIRLVSLKQDERLARRGSDSAKLLEISVDPELLPVGARNFLYLNGSTLGDVNLSIFAWRPRVKFLIPLDAFTRHSDRELILGLIEKRVGATAVHDSVTRELEDIASQSDAREVDEFAHGYTNMWLDDVHTSSRRKRIEPLDSGDMLQDGRYRIDAMLATGGQAVVYEASDIYVTPAQEVVLKEFVLPVGAGNSVRMRSFESVKHEAGLLDHLDHPGIVRLLDYFVEDHRAYLVLERIEGESLRDRVLDRGPMPEEVAGPVVAQMCDILAYLHGLTPPVVHRDLSPDNFMIDRSGRVRLIDFNVALRLEAAQTRTVVGKHNYMAPEQFQGAPVVQSDLYSLGATIAFLLTGSDPTPLTCTRLAEASPFALLVEGLTRLDLEQRYGSVEEALADLPAGKAA
ncbi:MAG: serine/threonine protein kinase [Candidatus Obscuribacterales bacterium]